jgi:hypothetical protein
MNNIILDCEYYLIRHPLLQNVPRIFNSTIKFSFPTYINITRGPRFALSGWYQFAMFDYQTRCQNQINVLRGQ